MQLFIKPSNYNEMKVKFLKRQIFNWLTLCHKNWLGLCNLCLHPNRQPLILRLACYFNSVWYILHLLPKASVSDINDESEYVPPSFQPTFALFRISRRPSLSDWTFESLGSFKGQWCLDPTRSDGMLIGLECRLGTEKRRGVPGDSRLHLWRVTHCLCVWDSCLSAPAAGSPALCLCHFAVSTAVASKSDVCAKFSLVTLQFL